MSTVYISIGNSDGKLSPAEWSVYWTRVNNLLVNGGLASAVHGVWHSAPTSPYVNACWCIEIENDGLMKLRLKRVAQDFRQDSIAWAVAETEFLKP